MVFQQLEVRLCLTVSRQYALCRQTQPHLKRVAECRVYFGILSTSNGDCLLKNGQVAPLGTVEGGYSGTSRLSVHQFDRIADMDGVSVNL